MYICNECGFSINQWQGKCPQCLNWGTLSETDEPKISKFRKSKQASSKANLPVATLIGEIALEKMKRVSTQFEEMDRVLGGGLIPGSVILIGGNPGAGKSTLILQVLANLARQGEKTLYITGEESLGQIASRAKRLNLLDSNLPALSETCIGNILHYLQIHQPKIIVIDSIQVMNHSDLSASSGSISQLRECTHQLVQHAKQHQVTTIIIGHVTKEGQLAGPKVLEHAVDASMLLETMTDQRFRILRASKNRFGAVNEIGIFSMMDSGMKEVKNPSSIFLSNHDSENPSPGSATSILFEGSRALMIEIQGLIDDPSSSYQPIASLGYDSQRLRMMLAIANKHGKMSVHNQGVFVNVVGGVKINETAADACLLATLYSSLKNFAIPTNVAIFGELGLSGELRAVAHGQERIREAQKHGFEHVLVPPKNILKSSAYKINVVPIPDIKKLFAWLQEHA